MSARPAGKGAIGSLGTLALAAALVATAPSGPAQAQAADPLEFSRGLLSEQERADYEARLGAAMSEDERVRLQNELTRVLRDRGAQLGESTDLGPTIGTTREAPLADPAPDIATDPSGPLGRAAETPLPPVGTSGGGGTEVGVGSVGGGGVQVGVDAEGGGRLDDDALSGREPIDRRGAPEDTGLGAGTIGGALGD